MTQASVWEKLEDGKGALRKLCPSFPKVVLTLGSGLAGILADMERETDFEFTAIPHLKGLTTPGHVGRVVIGKLGGVRVAVMQGRLHLFEGHDPSDIVFPYRVFAGAGAELFFLTNSSGGLRPDMKPLDLMLIRDHINFMGRSPLVGFNDERLGPRFPDMTTVYDRELSDVLLAEASRIGLSLREGVYAAILGPSYETPAEIRMLQVLGSDAVGMSTVPEAIALRHMGKRVIGISVVANLAAGVHEGPLNHEEVLAAGRKANATLGRLIREALPALARRLS